MIKLLTPLMLKKLQDFFASHKRLAIFMHNNPDPDALASALILRAIANHFKVKSDIVINGNPNQAENYTMIRLLKIPLQPPSVYNPKKHSLTALVDCQKSMKNHSFPLDRTLDINFDHHDEKTLPQKDSPQFKMIRPNVGATASLAMQTLISLQLPVTATLATAYAYALLSETRYLSREFTPYDVNIYKTIVPHIDFNIIATIQNTKRPVEFYTIMKKALASYQLERNVISCQLGTILDLDFVHQIAEEFARMEGVYLVIVTGSVQTRDATPSGKISLRGEHTALELGKWLKEAMQSYGSAGGHRTIAAGNFNGSEADVMNHVKKALAKHVSPELRKKILADL